MIISRQSGYAKGKALINHLITTFCVSFLDLVKTKRLTLKVEWIRSHLPLWQPDTWPEGVTKDQVFGNHYADAYAGDAAARHRLPQDVSSPVRQATHLVRKIQLRHAAILCRLSKRPKATSAPRPHIPRPPPLYTFFDASRHTVFQTDTRLICSFCRASVPTRDRAQAETWLQSPCTPSVVRI